MTANEFRRDNNLTQWWAEELKNNKILNIVLETMEQEHPARMKVSLDDQGDLSATRAALELGDTRGYSRYSNGLRHLAKPAVTKKMDVGETEYASPEPPIELTQG